MFSCGSSSNAAGNVVEDGHPIAHGEGFYSGPHSSDRAHGLMAEDARRGVRAGVDLLQIGPANAAAVNLDEHFPGPIAGTGTVSMRTSLTPR